MRQWMVDPKIMCRQHLLGEHVEHHMFVGTINKSISIAGYLRDNLLEPASLGKRHGKLVAELEARGYNHKSLLPSHIPFKPEEAVVKIDKESALKELLRRCPDCNARYQSIYGEQNV